MIIWLQWNTCKGLEKIIKCVYVSFSVDKPLTKENIFFVFLFLYIRID